MSGTLNSARLAAQMVDVPVRMVDSGTASFGISCCAWAAADAIAEYALSWTPSAPAGLRVAIGTSDISSALVQYTIGPSVGAQTGPGTSGLFVF